MTLRVAPTLRSRLFAVGLLGALLGLIVLWTAVTQFSNVHRSDRRAAQLSLARRYFQDADQAHDAIHADVLDALLVAGQPAASRARAVLNSDAEVFQRNLDRVRQVPLPAEISQVLQQLRPVQLTYLGSARRIGQLSVTAPAQAEAELNGFDDDFLRLQKAQGEVTNRLAVTETATTTSAAHVQNGAERRIVVTTVLALIGLLSVAVLLQRAGARVQRANAQLAAQLARERRIAETLQRSLLPKRLPELPGAAVAARFLPTEDGAQVGGDWYDVINVPGHGQVLVIGDVVGHDIAAAAMMGQLRPAMRSLALERLEPGDVLSRVNQQLVEFDPDQSAPCVFVTLDQETGRIQFANAGHPPPLLLT